MENNQTDKSWISVKKMGLPELEEISTTNFSSAYKSKEVLIQTKRGERFVAYCEKRTGYSKYSMGVVNWFAHGTGGRKMKVMSTVVAWMELPEKYEGE